MIRTRFRTRIIEAGFPWKLGGTPLVNSQRLPVNYDWLTKQWKGMLRSSKQTLVGETWRAH
jgi:hypothetical protein